MLTNTRSLLFFGVPHRGFSNSIERYIQTTSNPHRLVLMKRALKELSPSFTPTEAELRPMLEAFAPISDRFEIFTFCDTAHSILHSSNDPMTYYLGLPNERVIHINSNYSDLVRFSDLNADLQKVIGAIRGTVVRLSPSDPTIQTGGRSSQQVFRLDDIERSGFPKSKIWKHLTNFSESSKQWFSDLRSDAHRVVESRPIFKRSRIAILDTGIDLSHSYFKDVVNTDKVVFKSLVTGLAGNQDADGHGTQSAHLALLVAPHSKLFVARIVEYGRQDELNANTMAVANVCVPSLYITTQTADPEFTGHRWAVEQNVDIISLSLGYKTETLRSKMQ